MFSPQRLQEVIDAQGRRQDWLAAQMGYDPDTVNRVLNGKQPMSTKFALAAATVLQIPVDWLREPQLMEAVA